ncbi:UDP-Glycosyltransferase/glycogen phosphorylase [Dacryopinax primogenitus]|uniref:UDP-Glycosyltransferase/glycogen phosphorylase n=1 Tax=Dacryopinax primogenitus (strain DJM 731) TaxID=1858805 RepID=M5GAP7_DACPD|nr:UDP-Glycosyltransferase/glycogen phosphorylase [Dacryopinax primogenitus]EJU05445.1 UDP-Glycosyltransferase/glycogen phosphorylase [Dacryopinax primogenitus]
MFNVLLSRCLHALNLSINLLNLNHTVIVITHAYADRVGVRWLLPHLKVYYVPLPPLPKNQVTLPNFFTFLPYLRSILLREYIQLVHAHGALSSLGQEVLLHAHLMGVRTVFTDHSLFGFDDAASILTNKLLEGALRCVDAVVCVSHTGWENTVLRARLEPSKAHVIPNAIVPSDFEPSSTPPPAEPITIVVISRLVYRKGIDLLISAAPRICAMYPDVRFIVGGDGPKLTALEQTRETHMLQDRILLLGSVRHSDVRSVLTRGHIFLNTSLTESFGISILEAASCGLFIVSTRVGGVPEVLPADLVEFANPDSDDVIRALEHAISLVRQGGRDSHAVHAPVKQLYDWARVAKLTEEVYENVLASEPYSLWERMVRTSQLGMFAGPIYLIILVVDCFWFFILSNLVPYNEQEDGVHVEWDNTRWEEARQLSPRMSER